MKTVLRAGTGYIKANLKNGLDDHQSFNGALNILLAAPEYARDPEISDLLVRVLSTKFLGIRWQAATILHAIGDPLGIVHLTYNTLKTHPILGTDNTKVSGWGEFTARVPGALTDECIDLLVEDMRGPRPVFHGGTLAYVAAEKIVPRVLPLLKEGADTSRFAAYVLAAKQHESALDIVADWLKPENFTNGGFLQLWALWAARLFPHERLLSGVRSYIDPNFSPSPNEFLSWGHTCAYYAQYISDLYEVDESIRVPWMMNKYYRGTITEIRDAYLSRLGAPDDEVTIRLMEPVSIYAPAWDTWLLIGATSEQRMQLGEEQKKNVLRMLRKNHLSYEQLQNGRTCPFIGFWVLSDVGQESGYNTCYGHSGFHITYDDDDYVRAGTEWMLYPERHTFYLERPKIGGAP